MTLDRIRTALTATPGRFLAVLTAGAVVLGTGFILWGFL